MNNFSETNIFRTTSRLLKATQNKVRNAELNVQRTVGDSILKNIGKSIEYAKIGWGTSKNDVRSKLIYMVMTKREISKSEALFSLLVNSGCLKLKHKKNESYDMYIQGGAEMSLLFGELNVQLNSMIESYEKKFSEQELIDIYSKIPVIA